MLVVADHTEPWPLISIPQVPHHIDINVAVLPTGSDLLELGFRSQRLPFVPEGRRIDVLFRANRFDGARRELVPVITGDLNELINDLRRDVLDAKRSKRGPDGLAVDRRVGRFHQHTITIKDDRIVTHWHHREPSSADPARGRVWIESVISVALAGGTPPQRSSGAGEQPIATFVEIMNKRAAMAGQWRPRYTLLGIFTLSYFATRVQPVVIGPFVPDITDAFGTSEAAIGAAITGLWVAYALVQLPSGFLADRIGRRPVVILALLLGGIGSLVMAAAPSMLVFAVVAVALGSGVGLYYNVGVLALAERFRDTGSAIGIHRIGAQVAGIVTPVIAVAIGAVYGWRIALLLGAVAMLPMVAVIVIVVDSTARPTSDRSPLGLLDPALLTGFFSRRPLLYATTLASIGEFVAVANTAFLPTFLIKYHGIDQTVAGVLFSLYFIVVSITHPVAGWLADHSSADGVIAVAMAIGATTHALLVVLEPIPATYLLAAAIGLAMAYNIPLQSSMLDTLGGDSKGTWFGAFRTVYVLFGSLGGVVAGTVATRAGWAAAYGLLAGLFTLGLMVIGSGWFRWRHREGSRLFAAG